MKILFWIESKERKKLKKRVSLTKERQIEDYLPSTRSLRPLPALNLGTTLS